MALLGIDVADLVERVIRGIVDLAVPDFGSGWAAALVSWLVALPDVSDPGRYPQLEALRSDLVAAGFGLLGASFAAASLAMALGTHTGQAAVVVHRAAIAAAALAFYPTLVHTLVDAVNALTAAVLRAEEVREGLDAALGGAILLAAASAGLSLGLAVIAALGCLYFIAALIVMKIADTTMLAVLELAGALVWGLYVLPGADWLARAWTSGLVAAVLLPVAWTLIFATAALLSADALVWSAGAGDASAAPAWLEDIIKPFVAAAAFWLAYKSPAFLLAGVRVLGISPAALITPQPLGRPPGPPPGPRRSSGAQGLRNANRFERLRSTDGPRPAKTSAVSRRPAARPKTRTGATPVTSKAAASLKSAWRTHARARATAPAPVAAAVNLRRRSRTNPDPAAGTGATSAIPGSKRHAAPTPKRPSATAAGKVPSEAATDSRGPTATASAGASRSNGTTSRKASRKRAARNPSPTGATKPHGQRSGRPKERPDTPPPRSGAPATAQRATAANAKRPPGFRAARADAAPVSRSPRQLGATGASAVPNRHLRDRARPGGTPPTTAATQPSVPARPNVTRPPRPSAPVPSPPSPTPPACAVPKNGSRRPPAAEREPPSKPPKSPQPPQAGPPRTPSGDGR